MSDKRKLVLLFLSIFLFRLFFGLCQAKWMEIDEQQTYLIGLKCYTTGTWPYFGPDVNGMENSFQSQTPGALEGLMVGLPFYLLPIPEAPFIFLNLMTAAAVLLLAFYIHRRIPALSLGWLSLWITLAPWSLHEATCVINPSYIFLPSILFFIGFMEATPRFTQRWISSSWANALMGMSLFWIMQFHFSYVYLIPLTVFSLWEQFRESRRSLGLFYFVLGALPPLAFIAPTYIKYGLASGNVASGFAVPFNWDNVREFWTIFARFLSLVSFEMPRFIGQYNSQRYAFLLAHPLLLVPGALLWIAGLIQAIVLFIAFIIFLFIIFGFIKWDHPVPRWKETTWLALALLAMVEMSFWFTVKMPISHIYFVLFPFIMVYSCYVWVLFAPYPHWRTVAKVFLALGLFFQVGYALVQTPTCSIYPQRAQVAQAIQQKNYHLMGERRPGSLY